MGQLVISLLAYHIVGPLVLAVGTAALGTLAILAGVFSLFLAATLVPYPALPV